MKKDTMKNENSELKNNSSYNSLINEYGGKEIPRALILNANDIF